MLTEALAADLGPVELCCTPDTDHPFFADCARRFGIGLQAQAGADLGARMVAAFDRALSSASTAVLVGSDIPALNAQHLRQAGTVLRQAEAVFIPAEDGGYVLVGLASRQPGLFEDVDWGGEQVMAQTRARATALGVRIAELEPLWDLDRPSDLARIAPELLAGLAPKGNDW
jgi:rSAM/selenodomain-associated transferase 1